MARAPLHACHGDMKQSAAAVAYPNLAGQPSGYLVKQLEDFASKRRLNPVMQAMAKRSKNTCLEKPFDNETLVVRMTTLSTSKY